METEILEISSDSNETTIESSVPELKTECSKLPSKRDDDLDYLFNKYLGDRKRKHDDTTETNLFACDSNTKPSDGLNSHNPLKNKLECVSSDDDDSAQCSNNKKIASTDTMTTMTKFSIYDSTETDDLSVKYNKTTTKEKQKLEKEAQRLEKLRLKELKKEEDKRNKALKDALANHYRNMKPENCIKFVKVEIDTSLTTERFFQRIVKELQDNGISYATISHEIPSIVTWKTQLNSHILDSNAQLIDASNGFEINEVLLVIKWNDFLVHVHDETFISFIENIYTILVGKRVTLCIYGLGNYYQYQKRKKNREFKGDITNTAPKSYKDDRIYGKAPTVSRRTVEYILTEVQLMFSISHKMVETEQEIASFIFQITKSIAQAPYKKEKLEKFSQCKWFLSEDNRNCIKVDKNGNGLPRLWKQVICTFPLASLETAEAIAAVYPTPSSLFEAYKLLNNAEGEKLLQDIPIRRAAGPITTMRKIGPELSRKIYNSFNSLDPNKSL
ncbi:crossover junction endonuclease EME1 [Coccinella septempunctata]|uniref:crossover junction endonuclease EME1 n=1 Tax=Coccinella septempunctata TaxID=41139 RepID=UPI001D085D06|nr:crossover junction endonuclease EME1 [Coccinella septempunctata]